MTRQQDPPGADWRVSGGSDGSPPSLGDAPPLVVDGSRPAVAWVAALPHKWTTDPERLVLMVLACDARGDTSAPGWESLGRWTGIWKDRLTVLIRQLAEPTDRRPALIERRDRNGRVLRSGERTPGRDRTRYRLRLDINPVDMVGTYPTGRHLPDQSGDARPTESPEPPQAVGATGRGNRSGQPVGVTPTDALLCPASTHQLHNSGTDGGPSSRRRALRKQEQGERAEVRAAQIDAAAMEDRDRQLAALEAVIGR